MCDINGILEKRGILSVAQSAGWQPEDITLDGVTYHGWSYPVFYSNGQLHAKRRWKNTNGNGPRYFWPKKQPEKARYYFLSDIRTAIQENGGLLYLASGEPDVLAYHAAGKANTLCWFDGELSLPKTLVDDLTSLGVVHVVYAPDRDVTGMRAAAKLVSVLNDTGITYHIAQLPGDLDSKNDINQAWIDSEFIPDAFWGMVLENEIDPAELAMYRGMTGKTDTDARRDVESQMNTWRNEWIDMLRRATNLDGKHTHCPLPSHEDKHPSFRWSDNKNPGFFWPVCTCGIQESRDAPDQVAAAINADSWETFKAQKLLEAGYAPRPSAAPLRDPVTGAIVQAAPNFRRAEEVYGEMINVLNGAVPDGMPVRFPYTVLHPFGGFASWMWTGKAVSVSGISGGGKTTLMRALASALTAAGYDVAWWGPEWSPLEYGIQDLIRAGGLDFESMNNLMAVNALAAQENKPIEQVLKETGHTYPTQAEREHSIKILEALRRKPGDMFIIPDATLPVEQVMERIKKWADARRGDGGKPVALFWDYLQLSNHPGSHNWKWGNEVAGTIKGGCAPSAANLVAFMSTQTRKGDAERVRESGERLKVEAMQGLDESHFNLALTLTPGYIEGQKQDWAAISVEKNNMGQTGMKAVHVAWHRLLVMDKEYTDINLTAYFAKKLIGRDEDNE